MLVKYLAMVPAKGHTATKSWEGKREERQGRRKGEGRKAKAKGRRKGEDEGKEERSR